MNERRLFPFFCESGDESRTGQEPEGVLLRDPRPEKNNVFEKREKARVNNKVKKKFR